ncbi:uncharacterized protein LOC117179383 [Belonocnema kinseyi]|uniref:uncharacterized protein LOC117179383 n=1 Tax=Belonocnema kinseyi TaxID=2817044 RepID=UPI00143D6862|nr:uncharacterized protein LOC117179383 [Belonocnema kinseyi]
MENVELERSVSAWKEEAEAKDRKIVKLERALASESVQNDKKGHWQQNKLKNSNAVTGPRNTKTKENGQEQPRKEEKQQREPEEQRFNEREQRVENPEIQHNIEEDRNSHLKSTTENPGDEASSNSGERRRKPAKKNL